MKISPYRPKLSFSALCSNSQEFSSNIVKLCISKVCKCLSHPISERCIMLLKRPCQAKTENVKLKLLSKTTWSIIIIVVVKDAVF